MSGRARWIAGARRRRAADRLLRVALGLVVAAFCALLVAVGTMLVVRSVPALRRAGVSLVSTTAWAPTSGRFGILAFVAGTLETTAIAMVVVVPLGMGCALLLVGFVRARARSAVSTAFELMAGIPSVVYGLWGLQVGAPLVRTVIEPALRALAGPTGLVSGPNLGIGLLLGGLLLSVMALPTMVAVSRDVLAAVPASHGEGALALGATRWQALTRVTVPAARAGLLGAVTLAVGRALGETIAVTMVIGNDPAVAHSLLAPADTMTSVIASEFAAAVSPVHESALVFVGLALLAISVGVNAMARLLVRTTARGARSRGARRAREAAHL